MLLTKSTHLLVIILFLTACNTSTKEQKSTKTPKQEVHLGDIQFEINGNEAAKTFFEKGLLLLHSFEYEDARSTFIEAQEADTYCAMARWGEAMTHHHSLWQQQETEKADSVLQVLDSLQKNELAYALFPLEKDFIQAAHILFGEGEKNDRDIAYKDFMKGLHTKYPNDHEVASFYALSLLGAVKGGRDEVVYEKGAKIVQSIIDENPNHPGALHYLIHSYDDPAHAAFAKGAADRYSKVAPDAAHALHMPSHIYVAMGMWDEVIQSNIASWNASVKRMERKKLDNKARSYHALSWLQYGFLQNGETERAAQLLKSMEVYCEKQPEKQARAYLVAMKGAQLIGSNNWSDSVAHVEVNTEDLLVTKILGYQYLEGMKAYHKKDVVLLDTIISRLNQKRQAAAFYAENRKLPMCNAGGWAGKPPSQLDVDMCLVMEMELKARAALLKFNTKTADQWFQKACALDEKLAYSYGPPIIMKPAHEAYGEWLLESGKAGEALAIFEKSLERHPRRLLSLKGKKAAADKLGKKEMATAASTELEKMLARSKEWEGILN